MAAWQLCSLQWFHRTAMYRSGAGRSTLEYETACGANHRLSAQTQRRHTASGTLRRHPGISWRHRGGSRDLAAWRQRRFCRHRALVQNARRHRDRCAFYLSARAVLPATRLELCRGRFSAGFLFFSSLLKAYISIGCRTSTCNISFLWLPVIQCVVHTVHNRNVSKSGEVSRHWKRRREIVWRIALPNWL